MKTYNGNKTQERRRKRVFAPILYFILELTLAWILLSIINVSFDIFSWASWSYGAWFGLFLYWAYKTYLIYERQKNLKPV
ncbi:MAG TPA: hypothetical protein ENK76_02955 [Campylobacterales bacterium]|nr:hypothetical protein [Campylobacterales bacterium]